MMSKIGRKLTAEERRKHQQYRNMVNDRMPKSKTLLNCVYAFLIGGAICCIGQLVGDAGTLCLSLDEKQRAAFTSIVMIFLGALFTGVGLYDKLGSFAGAGSVVPITGFANSIVAPAMEHKREGLVLGVAANMFTIAGPVLVYGIVSGMIIGIIYWIFGL
ncbi:MAG: stage V sporulation protein AC [Clostridium sp.]|nr:stage V sporulation protein AC [Clostridium sp.]MDY2926596.1 stage V sporulation protein AC [Eubacteriales bacterium]MDY5001223.1 stage V sporulation protein AC [Eubacteriales bacterium]MDY5755416.1 stage V sporulation protein AC [Eubacteriales bacterium]